MSVSRKQVSVYRKHKRVSRKHTRVSRKKVSVSRKRKRVSRKHTRVSKKQVRHPYQEGDISAHEAMQPRRELGNFLFVDVMGHVAEQEGED